jgi:hypothetical protein
MKLSFFGLLFSFLLILIFISCREEKIEIKNQSNQSVSSRSLIDTCLTGPYYDGNDSIFNCSPGDYVIYENMVRFLSEEDYLQTVDYFNCASTDEVNAWLDNIPIVTSYEVYQEFLSQLCDSISQSELDSLLLEYNGEIIVEEPEQDLLLVYPLHRTLPFFRNMDGKFYIKDKLEAEIDKVRITVFEGGESKLNQIISTPGYPMDTVSYDGDSLFVINREIYYGPIKCCPNVQTDLFYWDNGNKRLEFQWRWADVSNPIENKIFDPIIQIGMSAEVKKRNNFWGTWNCHKRHLNFTYDVDWWVVPTREDYHNSTFYEVNGKVYTCRVSGDIKMFRGNSIGPYSSIPKKIVCVNNIEHTANIFESLDFPPEETFTQSCTQKDPRICNICPPGFTFDNANCKWNTACAPNGFVYQNGYYYSLPPGETDCSEWGGTWDSANCVLGWVPAGWEGEGFYYNNCYYVTPHCP